MRSRFLLLLLISTLGSLMGAALAADPPTDTSTLVFLGGIPIQRIRTSLDGKTPQQRAQEVQLRLNHILSVGPVKPDDFTVGQVQGDWAVLFKGRRFLTADAQTAKMEHSSPEALAQKWAARMRQVLPELTRPHGGRR